jgi:hypothetical protein
VSQNPGLRWSIPVTLVLLVVVGLASRSGAGDLSVGTSSGLGVLVLRVLGSIGILLALAGIVLFVIVRPGIRRRQPEKDVERPKVHWAIRLAVLLLYLALVGSIVSALMMSSGGAPDLAPLPINSTGAAGPPVATADSPGQAWPSFPVVFAFVALLVAIASLAWWWRARSAAVTPESENEQLTAVIDDGLAALDQESDPRHAVILAYLAMERALAKLGYQRNAAEAPVEYMLRVLDHVPDCSDPVHDLTNLFEEAKYSRHDIGPADRESAVHALQSVRASLAASA